MDRAGRLRQLLGRRGVAWSVPIEWHRVLGSTNDRARALAREGAPEWTLVAADEQTGGRGREGRRWVSPRGGLYVSLVLRPRFPRVALVPLAAGVAVAETMREHGVAAELKWPNDVLVEGRKLGGILGEASSGASGVEWLILGIGVNVSAGVAELGEDVAPRATSIGAHHAAPLGVEEVGAGVLARLRHWYDALLIQPDSVVGAWRDLAVPWWGELAEVRTGEGVLLGVMRDVDEEGALIVETPGGGSRRVLSGEVLRLRRAGEE